MKTGHAPAVLLFLLCGCIKDELPVPAHDPGGVNVVQVCLGAGYAQQVWLDLGGGAVVSTNDRMAWDLAFECGPDGWRVMLNGSRMMTAWDCGQDDIAQPTDTAGMHAGRRIDAPSGDPDSTAIGDWRAEHPVFVLDLGYGTSGQWLGLKKIKLVASDQSGYTFLSADIDGGDVQDHAVQRDAQRSSACFSLATNATVAIEPMRGQWDLCFTQYTHQFYEPYIPYLVAGALSDMSTVRVARITDIPFEQVDLADTLEHPFSHARNAIGYDWKTYDFDLGSYTVDASIVYLVRDAEGWYHKLHFVDYYGDLGQVGCPTFEVQRF